MFDRFKFSKRGHPPAPPGGPSRPSPSVPNLRITFSPTESDATPSRDLDGFDLKPLTTTGGSSRGRKQRRSVWHAITERFSRSPSPNPTHLDQPKTSDPRQSDPSTPDPPSLNLSPFPVLFAGAIDISRVVPGERIIHGNTKTPHPPPGRTDVNLYTPSPINQTPSSSAVTAGDGKKTIIAATRLVLQTAASALKFVSIPNLDQIPSILLTWLQVYETIDNNDENLKGLDDEVRNAHDTIFRPLQLWTGQVPPEIGDLIQRFNLALKQQLKQIEALKRQKLSKRVILATEITQEICAVKSCIHDAISRFSTAATTLNLLHTIRLSADYELSKLYKGNAEYSAVKSKSKCLENTRVQILESILSHLENRKHRFVWLRGSPGTGKTAISMSVASALNKQGRLAASFFWDKNRKGEGLASIEHFPSTVARQLALFNAEYEGLLVSQLRQSSALKNLRDSTLEEQMGSLIVDLMHKLLSLGKERLVIILDGLDECGTQEELESLMKLVLILDELPAAFAVLVSCRPESSVVSAWDGARAQGLVIPCEDVDIVAKEEKFHTIHRMVEEGLRGCIDKSPWKPSKEEVDAFVSACRGLPVIASIRVRDVSLQTHRGATLRSEFEYFRDLIDAPVDVNLEYLRVLRRAYMVGSSGVRKHIAEKYRQVIATINAVFEPLSVFFISQLSGIAEEEVLAILEPIGSIVDLSSTSGSESGSESDLEPIIIDPFSTSGLGSFSKGMQGIKFYHATMKEFIMGDPIGNENDEVFFIRDANRYFIGLPLLQFFNNSCERDVFGLPTVLPFGYEGKWSNLPKMESLPPYRLRYPHHLRYPGQYLLEHLDPSQLFAQGSNLQNEFNTFLTRNLVTFMHLVPLIECAGKGFPDGFYEFKNCDSFKLLKEAREKQFVSYLNIGATWKPWHLYRSTLPFTPMSSPFHKLYGHLSDPVRIFTISGEFTGHRIPLSEDLLNARMVMEAKLHNLPEQVDRQYSSTSQSTASTTSLINIVDPETKDEVQFNDPDFRNGIVTCAALSLDGHHVALGFGSGVVELADIDHQHTISRFQLDPPNHPVWIEFVHGSHRVAAEDSEGNVTILSHDMTAANLGNLPSGPLPAVTRVSDNGLFIIRVPRNTDSSWYDSLTLVSILGDPHLQHLAPPSSNNFTPTSNPPILASEPSTSSSASIKSDAVLTIPHRRTLGFSPGAHYIGAFDGLSAFTWSTSSGELISSYRVTDFNLWIMNPAVPFTCSYRIPDPVSPRPTLSLTEGEAAHTHYSETHAGHNLDSSWIKCPFYVLLPSEEEWDELTMLDIHSSAAGRTPLFGTNGKRQRLPVSFNGKLEFIIPKEYEPVVFSGAKGLGAWYGDRVPFDPTFLYSPRSSKDGTRILLQGWQTAPIVVDLSQVI